jgi:hypothetical protein
MTSAKEVGVVRNAVNCTDKLVQVTARNKK